MKTTLHICAAALAAAMACPAGISHAAGGGGSAEPGYVDPCQSLPTAEQCQDPSWLYSRCGGQEQSRLTDPSLNPRCADPCGGIEPTVEQCERDTWMSSACGQLEAPRWAAYRAAEIEHDAGGRGAPSADEVQALREASQCATATMRLAPVLTQAEVLLPDGVADDDGRRVVQQAHYGREGQRYIGGTSHYQGHVFREWTRASSDDPGPEPSVGWFTAAGADLIQRAAWDQNGVEVASCREFVYERFYDYSRFEDATMGLGDDYRSIFAVAYSPGTYQSGWWVTPRSAIGTRGMNGWPQTARDNAPLEPQIAFPAGSQPKSGLYRVGLLDADTRADLIDAYDAAADLDALDDYQGSCGGTLEGPAFCDETLWQDLIDGAAVTHIESWAWHKQMSDAFTAAGVLDEELALGDQRVQAFEQLLFRRSKVVNDIIGWWQHHHAATAAQIPDDVAGVLADPTIYMRTVAGDPISRQLAGQRGVRLRRAALDTMGSHTEPAPQMQWGGQQLMYAWYEDQPTHVAYAAQPPGPGDLLATPAGFGSQARLDALTRRLNRVDAEIEQALLDARDAGCLDADAITHCDWSPRHFAQRVLALYGAEREDAYQYCLDNTPQGFARLDDHDLGIDASAGRKYPRIEDGGAMQTCFLGADHQMTADTTACQGCNRWTASTTGVERYFRCLESQKQLILDEVIAQLGQDAITADKQLKLQGSTGERTQLGSDNFNITSSYGFGWALGNFTTYAEGEGDGDLCELDPEAFAHFDVHATALFLSENLVHAAAHARLLDGGQGLELPPGVDPNRLEVELVGIELVSADLDLGWDDGFDIVADGWSEGGTMISAGATFTIAFVPVTISGGVAGRIGIDYAVDLEVGDVQNCELVALTGKVTPYAGVEAFASATVQAVIAEAGVKVSLTLLRIDLPFEASISLVLDDQAQIALRVTNNLDLTVSFLSGRVAAYLRILWEEFEATLFSWNGPRFTKNLMSAKLDLPILSLKDAVAALQSL